MQGHGLITGPESFPHAVGQPAHRPELSLHAATAEACVALGPESLNYWAKNASMP